MLKGPSDDELPELRRDGYDAMTAKRIQTLRARQEAEQAERLSADPRWRRGRLRDLVAARYLLVELQELLPAALQDRRLTLSDVIPNGDRTTARQFVDAMPSADVQISLQVCAHRNPETSWTPNDYFDLDAMSVAVPYCDVVATERHITHQLRSSHCAQRFNTILAVTPAEITSAIAAL